MAKTLDYIEFSGRYYLIEELIYGCNLGEFLKDCVPVLDPYSCAGVLHHLAKGLAASHHAGVVHRDLKPTNVMVVGGRAFAGIKITDFGIAKMAQAELGEAVEGGDEALTQSATALGALPYMAPEMIDSFTSAGKPADIWSLGALAFELLTGSKPFGTGYRAVPAIQQAIVPELPRQVLAKAQFATLAGAIYDIIRQCLKKKPEDRPTADQLVKLCEGLCYSLTPRKFGEVSRLIYNGESGFIAIDGENDVFFHMASVVSGKVKSGQHVWFSQHAGEPRDRAFPVVPAL